MKYVPIIGMEVHVELKTKSKMFCGCKNDPDAREPNVNICEICTAQPGTLPVPNKTAIGWTVKIGKALGCSIRKLSKFDRKHYFYPDLPKAYQISQYDEPIAEQGLITLEFPLNDNIREEARIGITRVHLEEDTAKLLHTADGETLVDFNRAGTPLVEIVTDPDFKTALEAKVYCQELRTLFRYLGISDADMEKGHMRCEVNVSVQEEGKFEIIDGEVKPLNSYKLNNKVEIKNINSFRAVEKSINLEIERQTEMADNGKVWPQETRGWVDTKDGGTTVSQRIKENATDYRYFPEPDIPPFHPEKIAGKIKLPELPQKKRQRFHEEYGFSYSDAQILTSDIDLADFAEEVMTELYEWINSLPRDLPRTDERSESGAGAKNKAENVPQAVARLAGGWITSKLLGILKEKNLEIGDVHFSAENFAELIALIYTNRVNSTNALKILVIMAGSDKDHDPTHLMEEKGWGQVNDEEKIGAVIGEVIKNYPKQVAEFKSGKEPIIKFLIGMVMKATEGSADPKVVEKLLRAGLILTAQ